MRIFSSVLGLALAAGAAGAQTPAPPAEQHPVHVSGGVIAGSILTKRPVVFRPEILCRHPSINGVVHVIIGRDGRVVAISPIFGAELIRPSLMAAIAQWTYRPFLVDGKPVEVDTTVSMDISMGFVPSCAEGDPTSAVHVSSGVIAGSILTKGQPIFPPDTVAPGSRWGGTCIFHVILGTDGHVDEITPISGPEAIRAVVTAAVAQWTYKPYLVDGKAVVVDTTVTLRIE